MKHCEKHEHRKHHASGGGVDESAEDLKDKPAARTEAKKIDAEAEERKRGGRTRKERKRGGKAMHAHHEHKAHHEHAKHHEHKAKHEHSKHVGHVDGEHANHHAGRKPRKSGGRAACESQPFTSAHKGASPKGHSMESLE